MKAFEHLWAVVVYVFDFLTFSSWSERPASQQAVGAVGSAKHFDGDSPIFYPPNGPTGFQCDYSAMGPDWEPCSTPHRRGCWLKNATHEFNITTDYEKWWPEGTLRRYQLNVSDMPLAPDGTTNPDGKVFNGMYPGPWIQACWGDELEIEVTNNLKYNGTTVHWHGIRQLHTTEMDGVNGVTQCPIAPGRSFTYRFKAVQYGTSWYHSHYSLQYPDGLLGPLTIYGPSSADFDEAIYPILMTDWNHQSAFKLFYQEITPGLGPPSMTNILLNGTGRPIAPAKRNAEDKAEADPAPKLFNMTFQKGKKYLLRLINTSVATTFIFTIDNHVLTVISSDFVPIEAYNTSSVLIGIGQRYHVVVQAKPTPDDYRPPEDQSYWIRTVVADGCGEFTTEPDNRTGILYYEGATNLPTTSMSKFPTACSDEPYKSLVPKVKWDVGRPSNEEQPSTFQAGLDPPFSNDTILPPPGNFTRWELGKQPLWLDFSNPTIANLHVPGQVWDPNLVIVPQLSAPGFGDGDWIYLLITSTAFPFGNIYRNFVPAAHPIHLHGHDFAILQQSNKPFWDIPSPPFDRIKLTNPPRRDVALLPANGYLVLALRADNPGAWLVHCHIAWHASSGLAVQILEREPAINISRESMAGVRRVCDQWNDWYGNKSNWYDPTGEFQDDSGI